MKVAVVWIVCLLQSGGVLGANPNYSYHVKIDDPSHVNFQEKAETRKGEDAQGFYSVLEPNGALRTVSYTADERGFNPIVSYSYGHPQSSVAVHSATGGAAILKQPGVYAPAYVSDNRVQIVDKSNIYAAPPPALNFQAFSLPGPSAPVIVPAPLRAAAPVRLASAAITTNYAPAYVPPPRAYLPPPQPQVVTVQQQPQVVAVQQPQVFAVPQRQVLYQQQQQVVSVAPPPQVTSYVSVKQPQVVAFAQQVQPAKYLTVTTQVKVLKAAPVKAVAVVKDSYAEPPRDTFRDPNAPSYPDRVVKISELTAEYGPPSYVPPPPIIEAPLKVKVVEQQPPVQVVQTTKVVQPVVQQHIRYLPPPPQIQVQKVVAAPPPLVTGLYAGAIGFHTHTNNPDSYVHNYGTQGFQVTSSRKFNKGFISLPQVQKQIIRQPAPIYGPPPSLVVQKQVQPAPIYGPPPAQAVRVVQPRPVYGPPPPQVFQQQQVYQQQVAIAHQPLQTVQAVAPPPPQVFAPAPPQQRYVAATPVLAGSATPPAVIAAAPQAAIAITGKKQNPLTFAYSYDQGGAKVSHSYSGSGW